MSYLQTLRLKIIFLFSLFFLLAQTAFTQEENVITLNEDTQLQTLIQQDLWEKLLGREASWYSSDEALQIANNILVYQRRSGGWPKNIDMTQPINPEQKKKLENRRNTPRSTIDNGATYTQMGFLAKIFPKTGGSRYSDAFLKGLDYLLEAQYENGGWPQYYPLREGYYSHITFNDGAMIGVMRLLRNMVEKPGQFPFVDDERRSKAKQAIQKGIECILKTQIKVDGKLTAWCAQYDEKTLQPAKARSYELPSISGKESVGIVHFLMGINRPDQRIIQSIKSAVAWFETVRIEGIRVIRKPDSTSPTGYNKIVVSDPDAPAMWARFYKIGTNKPFYCNRDGSVHYKLSEISYERRNEYAWLGYWPAPLLKNHYPKWAGKWLTNYGLKK